MRRTTTTSSSSSSPPPSSPQQQQNHSQQASMPSNSSNFTYSQNSASGTNSHTINHSNNNNNNSMLFSAMMMDAFQNNLNNQHSHTTTSSIIGTTHRPQISLYHSFDDDPYCPPTQSLNNNNNIGMQNYRNETGNSEHDTKKRKNGTIEDSSNKKIKKDRHPSLTGTVEIVGATTTSQKPKRLVWTPSLHDLFVKAVDKLGLYEARPKEILQLMNVDHITTTHIKSHLQKYRSQFKKGNGANQNVAPSNSSNSLNNQEENSADGTGDEQDVASARLSPTRVHVKSEQQSTTSHSSSSSSSGHHPHVNNQANMTTTNSSNAHTPQPNTNHDLIFGNLSDMFPLIGQQQVEYLKDLLTSVSVNANSAGNNNNNTLPSTSNTTNSITVNVQPSFPYNTSSATTSGQSVNTLPPNFHIIQVNNNASPQHPIGFNAVLDQNGNLNTSYNPMTCHNDNEHLNEYLGILRQICKSEHDIYQIFEKMQEGVRDQRDLNFVIEGFRLGFLCGIRFHNNFSSTTNTSFTTSNQQQQPTNNASSPSTNPSHSYNRHHQ
ncbi:hypothetical protein FDP41_013670 [Naegleria fowleri]|uniref:HTH myb-type domain-containing protein n=1 Tax=Naegleria fowleri TaxID=5763 RepID=A0A6A5BYJ8_NAEFO|nr:uncharacterized protein FDP41_013670 [Naegleria fowleri]KAF0980456.1 hypothetical protein FDP41_013670 [Naegleria fowleri]